MSRKLESLNKTLLPGRDICEKFAKAEALDYLAVVIDKLEESKLQFDSSSWYDLIRRISTSYFNYYHVCIDEICEMILQRNVIQSMHELLVILTRRFDISDKIVNLILTLLVNFSDHSKKVAKVMGTAKIVELIIDLLLDKDLSDLNNPTANTFVRLCGTIIHNFVRDVNNRITHRTGNLKQQLVKWIQFDCKSLLGIISILNLSYMVDEDELNLLDAGCNAIGCLIDEIKSSLKTDLRSSGFTLSELINGLRGVSSNDNMKNKIVEEGGVPLLIDILEKKDGEEIEPILGTLENLIFNDKIRECLINQYKVEDIVKGFIQHKNQNVQQIIGRILWKIHLPKRIGGERNQHVTPYFDVFLSYSWDNGDQVLAIRDDFKQYGIRVWIDKEQMRNSVIEEIATGIESSRVFICAISSSYAKSPICRHEVEYAFKIKKCLIPIVMELKYKPKSWLDFIVGSKIYYEFSQRRDVKEELLKLRESVKVNLQDEMKAINRLKTEGELIRMTKHDGSESARTSNIDQWTEDDFQNWLEQSKLSHVKEYFVGFDGSFIPGLLKLRSNSADYLNNAFKNEFGMKLIDVLQFHKALDNLVL